jgi:hypothetical protein
MILDERKRLYLGTGDVVYHLRHRGWGIGRVVELMTSTLPGGGAFVRIVWNDGKKRVFNNDLDHYQCCYFFGVRLSDAPVRAPSRREPHRTRRLCPPRN